MFFFYEHFKKYLSFIQFSGVEMTAEGQFTPSLGQFTWKYVETVRLRKIYTPGSQKKFRHFTQRGLTCVFYQSQVWIFQ